MTVLPAVNVADGDEAALLRRLAAVPDAECVHLDVADGSMTETRSWQSPGRFRELAGARCVQVHLMVVEPERALGDWLAAGADEVVIHLDPLLAGEEGGEPASARLAALRDRCHAGGARMLLAGTSALPVRALLAHRAFADGFLLLCVTPGLSGEAQDSATPARVAEVVAAFPDVPVWVDGGVDLENLPAARDAGAAGAVAASAVFSASDPAGALSALQSV